MQSVAVRDPGRATTLRDEVNDLLVLWQHPESRAIVPIGRLSRSQGQFVFAYTRAASQITGFRPLPGFGDLRVRYTSDVLPAVFNQRVMSPERPDYRDYLETIGLTAAQASPWEQIVHSGGNRAGDTLQFMQVPTVNHGFAEARFLVNGIRHIPGKPRSLRDRVIQVTHEQQEAELTQLGVGDTVLLEAELDNPTDSNAILVTVSGTPLGWVPKALSASLRELVETAACSAIVHRVGGPTIPVHLRLVLDLRVPVPGCFQFDRAGDWDPLTP